MRNRWWKLNSVERNEWWLRSRIPLQIIGFLLAFDWPWSWPTIVTIVVFHKNMITYVVHSLLRPPLQDWRRLTWTDIDRGRYWDSAAMGRIKRGGFVSCSLFPPHCPTNEFAGRYRHASPPNAAQSAEVLDRWVESNEGKKVCCLFFWSVP